MKTNSLNKRKEENRAYFNFLLDLYQTLYFGNLNKDNFFYNETNYFFLLSTI